MRAQEGQGFAVETRWKEVVIYWEGRDGFAFDAGWGVNPPVLYVPAEEDWDTATATWMTGRRNLIIARLAELSGHRLEVGDYGGSPIARQTTR